MRSIILILVVGLHLTAAHFAIDYPYWRGDSFQDPASQWIRPCKHDPTTPPGLFPRRLTRQISQVGG